MSAVDPLRRCLLCKVVLTAMTSVPRVQTSVIHITTPPHKGKTRRSKHVHVYGPCMLLLYQDLCSSITRSALIRDTYKYPVKRDK